VQISSKSSKFYYTTFYVTVLVTKENFLRLLTRLITEPHIPKKGQQLHQLCTT